MEPDAPVLPQDPPSWLVRLIGWLLSAVALLAGLAAVFVQIPETVSTPFVLVSPSGNETLVAPIAGLLVQTGVEEGTEVAQGAVLFVLRSDEIRHWQTQRSTDRELLRALRERRTKLNEIQASQTAIKQAQISQMEREVAFREKHLATHQDALASMQKIEAEGGMSRIEMLGHRLNLAASEKDLLIAQKSLQQESLALAQLQTEWERQRLDEDSEAEKLRIRLAALEQQLEHCEGDLMFVRAPYAAVVVALERRSDRDPVQAGAALGQLARQGEQPHARLQLTEPALARLQAGQRVRFFFEAYPYQRYGTVTGRLDWITPAAVAVRDQAHFHASATLDQTSLTGAGRALPLRVGMTGEARVILGRRTLVEHIFEPVRQMRENLRP